MNKDKRREGLVGGLILIIVGVAAFASQYFTIESSYWAPLIVLGLGVVFLLAGIFSREFGFFIPGGILTGIGSGIALLEGPWQGRFAVDDGALFLLAFAGGWFLITLMGLIFNRKFHWWPLIPGNIIFLVGLAIAFGGAWWNIFKWLGYLWPLALIGGGIVLLYQAYATRGSAADKAPIEKPIEKSA